ncbi:Hypothetical predicted protein [Cloeon dipterum]|uniref:Death domain-containing protein n=1 Tax=Cloeon dipterum TaxID=197152 RepID=A0A8S1CM62_9INSE|nr:Hypothetical predicted protein [Cloeon dipterum]
MSGVGFLSSDEDEGLNVEDLKNSLEACGWDSEDDKVKQDWECDRPPTARMLTDPDSRVTAIIPASSSKLLQNAELKTLSGDQFKPKLNKMQRLCAPIISLGPHGMQFEEKYQVYLSIPVCVHDESCIVCFTSNTSEFEKALWERLPKTSYCYKDGFIILKVNHFSLFTVIMEEPYPERLKRIRKRNGGTLYIPDIPGVEVAFPKGCLEDDIDAYLRVIFDTETALFPNNLKIRYSLASPVIMIGPHGLKFPSNRPPVTINLPVPDLQDICKKFDKDPLKSLSVWHSPSGEMEPIGWKRLKTEIKLNLKHHSGIPIISFQVKHFSFFTVFWDIVSNSLYEAKVGMAHFANFVTFSMMCEAYMQETPKNDRFSLEVICYRSDRKLPDVTNLQHRAGACNKPKLIRPGKILVRLRSQMFEADVEAGELPEMCKEEPDFRGRDFEFQYACKFKSDAKIDIGTIGKVLVEKSKSSGRNDLVFEFNLYKSGYEAELNMQVQGERWTIVAIKELAANLQITDGNNWKKFAKYVGFNNNEIRTKLMTSGDPFVAMTNIYQNRGGTPDEFVQALFAVHRDISQNGLADETPPSSSTGSSPSNSLNGSHNQQSSPISKYFNWWSNKKGEEPPEEVDMDEEMPAPPSKEHASSSRKRSHRSSGRSSSLKRNEIPPKRRRGHNKDSSSDRSVEESDEEDGYRQNTRKLSTNDLWKASEHLTNIKWKELGRNLGLDEGTVTNIEQNHKGDGVREFAYQVLLQWKNLTAKKCTLGALYSSLEDGKYKDQAKAIANLVCSMGQSSDH